jgi:membrane fusion protein (multidrug efflux system)
LLLYGNIFQYKQIDNIQSVFCFIFLPFISQDDRMGNAHQSDSDTSDIAEPAVVSQHKRKTGLKLLLLLLVVVGLIYLGWQWFNRHQVETDNAYVNADSAAVTSMLGAQVSKVWVSDTQYVHQGDILLQLDDQDAKIALAQAEAQLAKAQRQFKQSQASSSALDSQVYVSSDAISSAQAQLAKAQAEYHKSSEDLKRRQQLVAVGAISKEELSSAQAASSTALASLRVAAANLAQAQSSQKAAKSNLAANNALIQDSTVHNTPDVLIAKANVDQAKLDLQRSVIRAPIDGVVAQRNVQVGQRLAPGSVVMKIVPIHQLYVDANFKESQLSQVRIGQKVKLNADFYGDNVVYHGKVVGFSGGTGAAFALIPAQNATGNWIKVVQRLPVRILLDPKELAEHPLRVGLSMRASIRLGSE